MVDVYTPEPMPEPPTFELPEPQVIDAHDAPGAAEEDLVIEDDRPFAPHATPTPAAAAAAAAAQTSAFAAPSTAVPSATAPSAAAAEVSAEVAAAAMDAPVEEPETELAPTVLDAQPGTAGAVAESAPATDKDSAKAEKVNAKQSKAEKAKAKQAKADAKQTKAMQADTKQADAQPADAAEATSASTELEPSATEPSPLEAEFDGLLAAPSPRPAMPLSAHPNFAGLGLAQWEPIAPRLLEPEAALTQAAQDELLKLFTDLFGPCGRYRLEWRTERRAGDDAMFAEIMTADLVRRVQNTIADVAELERPEPPKAIQASFLDREEDEDDETDQRFRQAS